MIFSYSYNIQLPDSREFVAAITKRRARCSEGNAAPGVVFGRLKNGNNRNDM